MIEIENYMYTEPVLIVYKIERNNDGETYYKIEKKFPSLDRAGSMSRRADPQGRRVEIERFINTKLQFTRAGSSPDDFIPTISIKISEDVLNGDILRNIDELKRFVNNYLEMKQYSNWNGDDISMSIISEINDEIFGIFPPVLTNEGVEFFIFNSSGEYKWYLSIFEGDRLVGKSKELKINHILEWYRELELRM